MSLNWGAHIDWGAYPVNNWGVHAVDQDGRPVQAFVCPDGVVARIHKNKVYVEDPTAWREASRYSRPIVMQVNTGEATYRSLRLYVEREHVEDQDDTIYVVAAYDDLGIDKREIVHLAMYGIGWEYLAGSGGLKSAGEHRLERLRDFAQSVAGRDEFCTLEGHVPDLTHGEEEIR